MTITDNTAREQVETISFDFDLPHAPEKVWRALTTPELLAEWLLPVFDFQLEPGAAFTFRTQPYPGWNGVVDCRFVEIEPNRKLVYTWAANEMELDTVVTFTLSPTSNGTSLSLVQSGFKPSQKQASGGARYGWKMMGGKLAALLETLP